MISGRSSVLGSSMWMLFLSVLLCWFPFVGPLVGGIVGGHKAGTVGKAFLAAVLPIIVCFVLVFWLSSTVTGIPLIGTIAALGTASFVSMLITPMGVGAILGGLLK